MNTDYTAQEIQDLVSEVLETADENGVLPIVQLGHPVLRQRATAYNGQLPTQMLEELLEAMRQTMYDAAWRRASRATGWNPSADCCVGRSLSNSRIQRAKT